jgi:hypothetical protein
MSTVPSDPHIETARPSWATRHREGWLEALQRQVGEAVLLLGDFDHLSWNEQIEEVTGRDQWLVSGLADWDGTLRYQHQDVIAPLEHLRSNWGSQQSAETLRTYKAAISTMVHETYHLVAPAGHEHREGRAGFEDPSSRMLEEGVTELCTHLRLDDIIRTTGLDRGAPGIEAVSLPLAYPQFVPGTKHLLEWAAPVAGRTYEHLLEALAGQTAAGKYPYLADALLVGTGLGLAVPAAARPACRRELENAGRSALDHLGFLPAGLTTSAYEALSLEAGQGACDAMRGATEKISARFSGGQGGKQGRTGRRKARNRSDFTRSERQNSMEGKR